MGLTNSKTRKSTVVHGSRKDSITIQDHLDTDDIIRTNDVIRTNEQTKENARITTNRTFTIEAGPQRTPLQFDKTNIRQGTPPSQTYNRGLENHKNSGYPNHGYDKSQNFYRSSVLANNISSTRSSEITGYNSTKPSNQLHFSDNSHLSGVYNRHGANSKTMNNPKALAVNPKTASNPNVMSLLRKDNFTLLGSHLQQEESKIFSKHAISLPSTDSIILAPSNSLNRMRSQSFDPTKFRAVNDHDHTRTSDIYSSSQGSGFKRTAGVTPAGPLDDKDEELIASIENEYNFF